MALLLAGLLVAATPAPALAASGPITIGSDGFARFDVTPEAGAAQVWIEVEDPSLAPANVVVRLGNTSQTVTSTALGTIAIVPSTTGTMSFAVALTTGATPDIAVTVIDGVGTILSSASYSLAMVDYRTLPQALIPSGIAGWLSNSGVNAALTYGLAMVGSLAVLVGVALRSRRSTKAAR